MSRLLDLLRHVRGEALRYVLIQLFAYALEFTTFWLVLRADADMAGPANVAGKAAAGLFALLAHRAFTFPGPQRHSRLVQALLYAASLALNALLGTLLLLGLLRLGLPAAPAKIISDTVMIVATFFVSRHVIFARGGVQR